MSRRRTHPRSFPARHHARGSAHHPHHSGGSSQGASPSQPSSCSSSEPPAASNPTWRLLQQLIQPATDPYVPPSVCWGSDCAPPNLTVLARCAGVVAPTPGYTVVAVPAGTPSGAPMSFVSSPAPSSFVHSPYSSSDGSCQSSSPDFHRLVTTVSPSPSFPDAFPFPSTPACPQTLMWGYSSPASPEGPPASAEDAGVSSPTGHIPPCCRVSPSPETNSALEDPFKPASRADLVSSSSEVENVPQPSSWCCHPRPWKRLRARRGTTTFACLRCHTRWQVYRKLSTAPPTASSLDG
eukprot:GGOE01053091.1.p1 GENE.GGOE01053091.1~~GGOE01053091.1.p1  ORF type:complete len:302 (-),score=23.88 GGOE01053091.1:1029-1913(-)